MIDTLIRPCYNTTNYDENDIIYSACDQYDKIVMGGPKITKKLF